MNTLLGVLVAALLASAPPCSAVPTDKVSIQNHYFGNSISSAHGYMVTISQLDDNGTCRSNMTIRGNGILKTIQSSCEERLQSIINLNGSLLVGDKYYSDTPSELITLQGDRCEKEVFHEEDGKFTSKVEQMDDTVCKEVKDKIKKLEEDQEKINEDVKKQAQQLQQQMVQLQQGLAQLFSGLPFWKK